MADYFVARTHVTHEPTENFIIRWRWDVWLAEAERSSDIFYPTERGWTATRWGARVAARRAIRRLLRSMQQPQHPPRQERRVDRYYADGRKVPESW